ncbi:hypothetical protein [Paraburkholderia bryophila]|uniref:Uncharacterized protein n=1 Tax=Paraburkholderia bryophila TaxID=420952 RepID=A0A7Y9WUP2_9BURK|nr:hypothetical protein [Paraburkholderia bryophila]NYH14045.1 hypothetical protein [Paraburkholderia bryophila]NYH27372.1 hypothetical protein [Paraburkholderia bryophila]
MAEFTQASVGRGKLTVKGALGIATRSGRRNDDLDIIGELCHFLEFARIVMALSWKPVILAMPVQAWQCSASLVGEL